MDTKFGHRQIFQIVRSTARRLRLKWKASVINLFLLILVIVYLVWWTYSLYQHQKSLMLQTILPVIGFERNTTAKLLPGIRTTILEPSHNCQYEGKNALAVVLVTTMAESWQRREVIRKTWASTKYETNIMVFFFSGPPTSIGSFRDLETEASLHGDLIVEDIQENYYGLATKTLRMLKWFQRNCPKSKYLIKADDDVYLSLPRMVSHLNELGPGFKLGGRVLGGRSPNLMNPFSKWYTPPQMWPAGSIPPTYLGGPCYIMKGELVSELLESSCQLPLYHLEDVFLTGMVASQRLKFPLTNFPGTFDPTYPALWYFIRKFFGDISTLISSLHTDGDFDLMRRVFADFLMRKTLDIKNKTDG